MRVLVEEELEHVVLVVELDLLLDALLVQRLQDHVTGAVGRVARTSHGRLAVVTSVAAKAPLVDLAVLGAVERKAHVLKVKHSVDGLAAENLCGVLINEVVATLDRVEDVPLSVVVFHVRKCRRHAALRSTGVRARGVELGENSGASAL